jgi:cephalosporin hydroxylase
MFEDLVWKDDRVILDDLVFRLEHHKSASWDLGDECFDFYKDKKLIDGYSEFFSRFPDFQPKHIIELGIWDGGSLALWFETFRPEKIVGIDLRRSHDSAYFQSYVSSNNLEERLRTYWGVNQKDGAKLESIITKEFHGKLDMVVDDASHLYGPTKKSFEIIFPFLENGGMYIIEDWAWEFWPEYQKRDHQWIMHGTPEKLISELIQVLGGYNHLIRSITIYPGFVVIEKGETSTPSEDFRLERHISRRPKIPSPLLAIAYARALWRRI